MVVHSFMMELARLLVGQEGEGQALVSQGHSWAQGETD